MARKSLSNVARLIDQVKQELPVEKSFLFDLQRSIEQDAKKSYRPPSKTYKPSSMHCVRNMYYQVIGADVSDSDSSYIGVGICNSGTDIHLRVQTAVMHMIKNNIDCEFLDVAQFIEDRNLEYLRVVSKCGAETKLFYPAFNMSFMCDGIIKYLGKYYILEIKTETSRKWFVRESVDKKHYLQATAYSMAFGINDVLFVYISRDTLDMKAYILTVTDDMKDLVVSRIEECNTAVANFKVPPIPTDLERSVCEYCNYKSRCRKDGR